MGHDRRVAAMLVPPGDHDGAGKDHRQAMAGVTDAPERSAPTIALDLPEPPQAFDLIGLQLGEHLLGAGIDDRRLFGHGASGRGFGRGYHAVLPLRPRLCGGSMGC